MARKRPIHILVHPVSPTEQAPPPAQEISRVYLRYLKRRTAELGLNDCQMKLLLEQMLSDLHTGHL